MGFVGLYTTGTEGQGYPPGVVRFLNVKNPPPRRGRPQVRDTLSLAELVDEAVARATFAVNLGWAQPEPDENP